MTIRIGVIGTGGMGGRHAHNLAHRTAHACVSAVMDADHSRATAVAAACQAARVFTDAEALIGDDQVDAVIIASPDRTHAGLAQACIRAGKPALCEKPLATTVADARAVVETEVAAGRRLVQLGFMREFDPAHRQVHDVITGGTLGRPLYFRGTHNNVGGGSRTADDVIVNSAVHDIHSARWLLGGQVERAFTQVIPADPARPDTCRLALVELTFDHHRLALIEMNAEAGYGYEVRVEVVCERGSAASDGLPELRLRQAQACTQPVEIDWLQRFDAAYVAEAQAWVQGLLAGAVGGPSTWDGYLAMLIAEACIESARTSQPCAVPAPPRPSIYP